LLDDAFRKRMLETPDSTQLTAVLSFPRHASRIQEGDDLLKALASMKQPVLDILRSMSGVQISTLPSLPHVVATASTGEWRALIERFPWLSQSESVQFTDNVLAATTQ
jgi:hypothetical protein